MDVPDADQPRYTRDELIAELGIDEDYAEKVWNAFGFARRSTDDKMFSETDRAALSMFAASENTTPLEAQVATARAIGQTMARLADWQADQLLELDRDPEVPWTLDQMRLAISQIQRMVWRRHLDAALARHLQPTDEETHELVVGFVDIVGYTSLSRRIGLTELQNVLDTFEAQVFEVVRAAGGHVIKTLGDAVMFSFTEAGAAAEACLRITSLADADEIPRVRVGLAYGAVLSRLGDVFGEPVNIAARLCGSARPLTILVDEAVGDSLADDDRFYVRSIGTLSVRGYRRLKARVLEANKYHHTDNEAENQRPQNERTQNGAAPVGGSG